MALTQNTIDLQTLLTAVQNLPEPEPAPEFTENGTFVAPSGTAWNEVSINVPEGDPELPQPSDWDTATFTTDRNYKISSSYTLPAGYILEISEGTRIVSEAEEGAFSLQGGITVYGGEFICRNPLVADSSTYGQITLFYQGKATLGDTENLIISNEAAETSLELRGVSKNLHCYYIDRVDNYGSIIDSEIMSSVNLYNHGTIKTTYMSGISIYGDENGVIVLSDEYDHGMLDVSNVQNNVIFNFSSYLAPTSREDVFGNTIHSFNGENDVDESTNTVREYTEGKYAPWSGEIEVVVEMPEKGSLISMDLGNGSQQYRVLRTDGTVAEVLAMYDAGNTMFSDGEGGSGNDYASHNLDTYLNQTWYETLSSNAKTAIVPKSITQDNWYYGDSGNPDYSGTYGTSVPGTSSYTISKNGSDTRAIGERNIYAISIQEVIDYLSDENVLVDKTAMLRNQNIWKMFFNVETKPSSPTYPWLRSARTDRFDLAWYVGGSSGYLGDDIIDLNTAARPAFQIDLSKIPFTKEATN